MRIPRSVRDLQVGRERNFSSQRLFHGLDLFLGQWCQQLSFRAVMTDANRCVKIISRFLRLQDINAVPRCAAGTVKLADSDH